MDKKTGAASCAAPVFPNLSYFLNIFLTYGLPSTSNRYR